MNKFITSIHRSIIHYCVYGWFHDKFCDYGFYRIILYTCKCSISCDLQTITVYNAQQLQTWVLKFIFLFFSCRIDSSYLDFFFHVYYFMHYLPLSTQNCCYKSESCLQSWTNLEHQYFVVCMCLIYCVFILKMSFQMLMLFFCSVFISAPNLVPPLESSEEEGATNNAGKCHSMLKDSCYKLSFDLNYDYHIFFWAYTLVYWQYDLNSEVYV